MQPTVFVACCVLGERRRCLLKDASYTTFPAVQHLLSRVQYDTLHDRTHPEVPSYNRSSRLAVRVRLGEARDRHRLYDVSVRQCYISARWHVDSILAASCRKLWKHVLFCKEQ